jgi:hypothetical protein
VQAVAIHGDDADGDSGATLQLALIDAASRRPKRMIAADDGPGIDATIAAPRLTRIHSD